MFTALRSLALILFIAAPMAIPTKAKACGGGYGMQASTEYQEISQALYQHFEENRRGVELTTVYPNSVQSVTSASAEALPRVSFTRGTFRYQQELRMRHTSTGWQVVGGQAPVRI